jgi:hypothetical protein
MEAKLRLHQATIVVGLIDVIRGKFIKAFPSNFDFAAKSFFPNREN